MVEEGMGGDICQAVYAKLVNKDLAVGVCAREGSRGGNICQLGLLAASAFGRITAVQNNGDFISESSILYPPTV